MGKNQAEVKNYKVICVPFKGAPRDKTKSITVAAWSSENAVSIACKKLDIHPHNYGYSTEEVSK